MALTLAQGQPFLIAPLAVSAPSPRTFTLLLAGIRLEKWLPLLLSFIKANLKLLASSPTPCRSMTPAQQKTVFHATLGTMSGLGMAR